MFRNMPVCLLIVGLVLFFCGAGDSAYAAPEEGMRTASKMHGDAKHAGPGMENSPSFDDDEALKISQAAIGRSIDSFTLLDRNGREVRLADFRGKPLIVSLIYTACFHICPMITQNLARVSDIARDTFGGESFQMVTIGFDTSRDSPDKMRIFARQQGVAGEPGWVFLSADKDTMKQLTDTLGFVFFPSAKGFDHLAQTTVIDANGVIYRQIYGQSFEPPLMIEPLKELLFGRSAGESILSGLIGKARLWCTTYDPRTDSYRFQYSMVFGFIISILFLIGGSIFLIRMWLKVLRNLKS
ncbi:MAG: SCO family protein [Mariprofundaceae bacterium]